MSRSTGFSVLRLGIFFVSLGAGWIFFSSYPITLRTFVLILIAAGAMLILVSLFSWRKPSLRSTGLVTGVILGIIVSMLLTSGVALAQNISDGGFGPYTAQEIITYNGVASESSVYFEVHNFNGPITISTWDRASYSVNLTIRARDTTSGSAQSNLAALKTSLDESVAGGSKRLILVYDMPLTGNSAYSIEVQAFLPSKTLSLDLSSSNGGIFLSRINGTTVSLSTSNGQLELNGVYVDRLEGSTSNGRIQGTVDIGRTTLSTSNGQIRLTIPSLKSGSYDLVTSNGAVTTTVSPLPSVGYSLDLSTSNGVINISLPNLSYSLDQRTAKRAQTTDFSGKAIQLTINIDTSNANISVETS
ncbi:MAG: hypothetical protein QG670_1809 [Thermoproteota archaeon]|nr:hypothetical protein [Thermoproteota archaeon]